MCVVSVTLAFQFETYLREIEDFWTFACPPSYPGAAPNTLARLICISASNCNQLHRFVQVVINSVETLVAKWWPKWLRADEELAY